MQIPISSRSSALSTVTPWTVEPTSPSRIVFGSATSRLLRVVDVLSVFVSGHLLHPYRSRHLPLATRRAWPGSSSAMPPQHGCCQALSRCGELRRPKHGRFGRVQLRQVTIERFRAIEALTLTPGPQNVLLGPQNAGKSTVLEALDLLLHHGIGRPRPAPTEIDYFGRDPTEGFVIEAVVGALDEPMLAETNRFLEGWRAETCELVGEPEGEGIEPVVRVRVRGTPEFELLHEFAKPEAEGCPLWPSASREPWLGLRRPSARPGAAARVLPGRHARPAVCCRRSRPGSWRAPGRARRPARRP